MDMRYIYFKAKYSESHKTLNISEAEFKEICLTKSLSSEVEQRLSVDDVKWLKKWLQHLKSRKAKCYSLNATAE
jgi:hypothetical protein